MSIEQQLSYLIKKISDYQINTNQNQDHISWIRDELLTIIAMDDIHQDNTLKEAIDKSFKDGLRHASHLIDKHLGDLNMPGTARCF